MTEHSFLVRQNQLLRDEVDTLREHVRQLEDALAPKVILPRHWRLQNLEEQLLSAIRAAGSNYLHTERAMIALYGITDDWPDPIIIRVLVATMRRKLRRAHCDLKIENIWGRGWRLSPESCAIFDAALACDQARWPRPISSAVKSIRGISSHA